MRTAIEHQLPLALAPVRHEFGKELGAASARLARLDVTVYARALQDLGGPSSVGRGGMSGEQVLRALVLRQVTQWSYNELAFHLEDSATCRAKRNIKMLTPATLEAVNRAIARQVIADGIETGERVRGDSGSSGPAANPGACLRRKLGAFVREGRVHTRHFADSAHPLKRPSAG